MNIDKDMCKIRLERTNNYTKKESPVCFTDIKLSKGVLDLEPGRIRAIKKNTDPFTKEEREHAKLPREEIDEARNLE
jgi:hypothetical protein